MTDTIKIKTWSCSACDYKQDFDPTGNLWGKIFPKIKKGWCPNPKCGLQQLTPETDSNKQIKVNIATDTEIDNVKLYTKEMIDEMGKTRGQLKAQAATDRAKFNRPQWRA